MDQTMPIDSSSSTLSRAARGKLKIAIWRRFTCRSFLCCAGRWRWWWGWWWRWWWQRQWWRWWCDDNVLLALSHLAHRILPDESPFSSLCPSAEDSCTKKLANLIAWPVLTLFLKTCENKRWHTFQPLLNKFSVVMAKRGATGWLLGKAQTQFNWFHRAKKI